MATLKEMLEKLRNLPEHQKKIILFSIVGIAALALGSLWVLSVKNSIYKMQKEFQTIPVPSVQMPDIQIPSDIIQTTSPTTNIIQTTIPSNSQPTTK